MTTVYRYKPTGKADRSDERRENCEAIVRRQFPTATEVLVHFLGSYAVPFADVWHSQDGKRRCTVVRVHEEDE